MDAKSRIIAYMEACLDKKEDRNAPGKPEGFKIDRMGSKIALKPFRALYNEAMEGRIRVPTGNSDSTH